MIIRGEKNTRISPNSPPNALYWRFKGPDPQVSHTLSARSLPVFAEPNASPSAPTVCPLLCSPFLLLLLLPSSFPPSLLLPHSKQSGYSTFRPRGSQTRAFTQIPPLYLENTEGYGIILICIIYFCWMAPCPSGPKALQRCTFVRMDKVTLP